MQMTTPRRRWAAALIAGASTFALHGTAAAAAGSDADGYDSPAAAAVAYAEAVAAGDLSAATDAFAIETFVEHFDLAAWTEYIGSYGLTSGMPVLPGTDPFNAALNVELRRGSVANEILFQYLALAEAPLDHPSMTRVPADEVPEFISALDAALVPTVFAGFAGATPVEIADVDPELAADLASENAVRSRERMQAVLGADELVSVALQAGDVVVLFDAVRYGDSWWLHRIGGAAALLAGLTYEDGGVLDIRATG